MTAKYCLVEYSYATGSGHVVGHADCIEGLPWGDLNTLNTYAVQHGSVTLAEFEGSEAFAARLWLIDNPDYNGIAGVKVWKGGCSYCGAKLLDGKCGCDRGM